MTCRCPEGARIIAFEGYDPRDLRRRESLLGLGNGVLFVRASAPWAGEEDECHYPGTYRAGCYDRLNSTIAGKRVQEESLVRLPDWLPLTFRHPGEKAWFAPGGGEILHERQALDTMRGIATRETLVRDSQGRRTVLRERRLVSMARPELAALRLEIEPQDWAGRIEIRSVLRGEVTNGNVERYRPFAGRHLGTLRRTEAHRGLLLLTARTRQSRIEVAVAARTLLRGAHVLTRETRLEPDGIAEHLSCDVVQGRPLVVEKMAAIVTSRDPAIAEAAETAIAALREAPDFAMLEEEQARAWARLWRRARIEAEDVVVCRATALHAFHLLQTASPLSAERDLGFPARGWQEAYQGHVFWDEIFAFPFLDLRFPEIARGLLLYRHRRLRAARAMARRHGLGGAMFPWRSASDGREVTPRFQLNPISGRWMRDPTRLQRHIGAAVARNIWHHYLSTGDVEFLSLHGGEMLLEIARFWASLAEPDAVTGRFRIRGVIGPDEYHNAYPGAASPGLDDNAYTNVMAAWTLARALDILDLLPSGRRAELCDMLGIGEAETALWDRVSRRLRLVFLDDGVIAQFDGFDALRPADPCGMRRRHGGRRLDWALEAAGETADAYQLTKQADVLMLLHLLPGEDLFRTLDRMGYAVTEEQLRRTADYYLARITHESSLSRVACAGALARLDPTGSWRFFQEALGTDLDAQHAASTAEGLHLGAMAGTLDVLQRHYLGLSPGEECLHLDPSLPPALRPVRLGFRYRGGDFGLAWTGTGLRIEAGAENRAPVTLLCRGRRETLRPGGALVLPGG